jgi:hypothetical protein
MSQTHLPEGWELVELGELMAILAQVKSAAIAA